MEFFSIGILSMLITALAVFVFIIGFFGTYAVGAVVDWLRAR